MDEYSTHFYPLSIMSIVNSVGSVLIDCLYIFLIFVLFVKLFSFFYIILFFSLVLYTLLMYIYRRKGNKEEFKMINQGIKATKLRAGLYTYKGYTIEKEILSPCGASTKQIVWSTQDSDGYTIASHDTKRDAIEYINEVTK